MLTLRKNNQEEEKKKKKGRLGFLLGSLCYFKCYKSKLFIGKIEKQRKIPKYPYNEDNTKITL
ncbi:hypothetical protein ACMBCN_03600 [Candidatus Liberibacter asiaticus]|nr:hypothetical protein [Candidatus Liberibacter asiaticus]